MEIGDSKREPGNDDSELRYSDRTEEKEPDELYGDDDDREQPRSSYRNGVEESREYDEDEERWHLHRYGDRDREDEAPRDRDRNGLQEKGDYDEDEERWHL
ncbi:MAG TPA: hypothetical protein V6C85_16110 [Allocoleopsis sp.]